MLTFKTFFAALTWAKREAREYCLPCHEWVIEKSAVTKEYLVAIRYKASGEFVAYAS